MLVSINFRTLSIECCYQNLGLATLVAIAMFQNEDLSDALLTPIFYGLVQTISVGIYCVIAWKIGWTKAPADATFCETVCTSYEVLEAEKQQSNSDSVSDYFGGKDDELVEPQPGRALHGPLPPWISGTTANHAEVNV